MLKGVAIYKKCYLKNYDPGKVGNHVNVKVGRQMDWGKSGIFGIVNKNAESDLMLLKMLS